MAEKRAKVISRLKAKEGSGENAQIVIDAQCGSYHCLDSDFSRTRPALDVIELLRQLRKEGSIYDLPFLDVLLSIGAYENHFCASAWLTSLYYECACKHRTLRIHPTFLAPQEGTTPALRSLLSCARTVLLSFTCVACAPPRGSALRRNDIQIRFFAKNELS